MKRKQYIKPVSPCLDCDARALKCHTDCEKYQKFKDELDTYQLAVKKAREADGERVYFTK